MSNGTKILIIILLVIIAITCGIVYGENIFNKKENKTENKINSIFDSLNKTKENIDTSNENKLEKDNEVTNSEATNTTTVKEEQEGSKESTKINNEQKAIQLAQKEWGISINSYKFEVTEKSGSIYTVTVRSNDSNLTQVAIYKVNIDDETVTEE